MKFFKYLTMIVVAITLAGCGTKLANQFTQFIGEDPKPPEGYNPIFIAEEKGIDANVLRDPVLTISRTDPYGRNRVRHYIHLTEEHRYFINSAATDEWKDSWCEVVDAVNGQTYKITDFTIEEVRTSDRQAQAIAMVMDFSGSMGDNRVMAVEQAVINFINDARKPQDKVALIKYDDSVGIESSLTDSKTLLLGKLPQEGMGPYGGTTATLDGIDAGLEQLVNADPSLERYVIVFTDGMDTDSKVSAEDIIQKARQYGVAVCAIDYGVQTDEQFLKHIAESTNGTYHHIYGRQEFDLVFKDIYNRLEHYYVLEYTAPDFGRHDVAIKFCHPKEELIATSEYFNEPYVGLSSSIQINFDVAKASIKKNQESEEAFDYIIKLLNANNKVRIALHGHTDSTGDPKKNLKLSQARAEAVKAELVSRGADAGRIDAIGFGDTKPIASNETAEGRAQNRRTEFIVLGQ